MTRFGMPPLPDDRPPLAGFRVIDFTHFIAGPYCTMMLGDMGADVIKIENADAGDGFRQYPPFLGDESVPYLWTNRNKRSVALDLKTDLGRGIALDLIMLADVVVENFATGVMQRLGLGYEQVKDRRPDLIYCSISAYGRDGPFAHRNGFDPILQAESGFMSMNGAPGGEPMRAGPAVMDLMTAMMAGNAILAALLARSRSGRGQLVEATMMGAGISLLANFSLSFLATGDNPTRFGNTQPTASPVGRFDTADGAIYLSCANDRTFARLSEVLAMSQLARDARFLSSALRRTNREALFECISGALKQRSRDEWLTLMHEAGVPAGAIRTVEEALQAPEVLQLGLLGTITHPSLGAVPNIAWPVTMHGTRLADPIAAAPLGADTEEVLTELLRCDPSRLEELRRGGAFGERR